MLKKFRLHRKNRKFETIEKRNSVLQVQELVHASLHCQMQPKRVICGNNHVSMVCSIKKSPNSKCKCVN